MDDLHNQVSKEILREMLINLSNNFDKSEGGFASDILAPPSLEFAKLRDKLSEIDRKRNIFNLSGEELDLFVGQFTPIQRHKSTKAIGEVLITGTPNTYVQRGTLVGSVNQTYIITKNGRLDSNGKGVFPIECTEEGSIGNTGEHTVNIFPISVSGLRTVTNEEPIVNGFDKENDQSLRERYFNYINLPTTSGNRFHYLYWAKQITGVGLVRIQPLWNGDNTVRLIVTDSNGQPASDKLLEELQEYIDPIGEFISEEKGWTKWGRGFGQAPVGAFCTIISAKPVNITIEADLKLNAGYTIEEVTNEFRAKVADRFSTIALDEDYNTISLPKIGCIILGLDGVQDYNSQSLKLNGKRENIVLTEEEVGVFDEVIFNEI